MRPVTNDVPSILMRDKLRKATDGLPQLRFSFCLLPSWPVDETKATSLGYSIQKLLLDRGHDHGYDVSRET